MGRDGTRVGGAAAAGAGVAVEALIAGLVALLGGSGVATIIVAIVGGRFARMQKRDELQATRDVSLQELVDKRVATLITQLGARVDELEDQAKQDRATIHANEVEIGQLRGEVDTLRRENVGLRAQLARLTGLAAGVEADTAGGGE